MYKFILGLNWLIIRLMSQIDRFDTLDFMCESWTDVKLFRSDY